MGTAQSQDCGERRKRRRPGYAGVREEKRGLGFSPPGDVLSPPVRSFGRQTFRARIRKLEYTVRHQKGITLKLVVLPETVSPDSRQLQRRNTLTKCK